MTLIAGLALLVLPSCGGGKSQPEESDVVVSVGDTVLTLQEVLREVPSGLNPEDSAAMVRSVVESWLRRHVLLEMSEKSLGDRDEIERMVDDYRTNLILSRYLSKMEAGAPKGDEQKQVEKTYLARRDSLVLEEPVVKGLYLKVPENDSRLSSLRSWMANADEESIDNLERYGMRHALQYEYFLDRWHPWHEVADLVPYRFFDADAFLASTPDFETACDGSVYIIHISEYRGSGTPMPEDYAKAKILEMLRHTNMSQHRDKLISSIYEREMENGRLKSGLYDPSTGSFKTVMKKNNNQNE